MTTVTATATGWSFRIDRGGTFTDVIGVSPDGSALTVKLLSTSPAYADAAVEAMSRLLGAGQGQPFPADRVAAIRMGTTVATNALLERKGARTLFVTTRGFADSLAIGDQSRPDLFALNIERPPPLYAGVLEADERLAADGSVVETLDEAALARGLAAAVAEGFTAAAICFLHSDLNPAHEQRAAALARDAGFAYVSVSSTVSPLPRFLPRAQTTVADAYLTPILREYIDSVEAAVAGAPLWFMTSAGGLARASNFLGRDAVLSGPAGGAVGVAATAREAGVESVLGFDMGGTSTDVCRFAGALERREAAVVAGARLRAPMLDVQTVASGGGSILAFDGARARVGPASAGADPGPACYGRGGPATVTDANLVLGRIDPAHFPSTFGPNGDHPLDAAAAHAALNELAAAMGAADARTAAQGFIAVAVEQMAQAIGRISTERGFDPRDHALVAFGGAAGQVCCEVADALGITEILSPLYASLLSAHGIGQAQVRVVRQAGVEQPLGETALAAARDLAARLTSEATTALAEQGAAVGAVQVRLGLRYDGADAVLTVPFDEDAARGFEDAHRRLFGFAEPGRTVLIARVEVETEELPTPPHPQPSRHPGRSEAERRDTGTPLATAGSRIGAAAPLVRDDGVVLANELTAADGPILIVRPDTQIAVAAGWRAAADNGGLIRLTRVAPLSAAPLDASKADPVTLELFNRRFMGVAEAMGTALERTAQSVNIKERLDFSCALFDADGGLVANAPHMPVHLGSMGASVRAVRDRHPVLEAGSAYALNNPYAGGTHLPDVTVVMPVFLKSDDTAPRFYVAARGHHADVGGVQPGSMPPFSKTLADEGVLLDALPIMAGGVFLEAEARAAFAEGAHPARNIDQNIGDLKAQIAACQAGAAAVAAMIAAHGGEVVARYMGFVQQNAQRAVAQAVRALKDGSASRRLDGGGEISVTLTVDADAGRARLDFTASSDQLDSNFNAPSAIVDAAALYVFRTLAADDIPLNAGCLAPLDIAVRRGSLLDPNPPAAVVAGNVETSQHVVDALYGAMGVMADSQGSMNNFTFGDETRQYYETLCGGAGATASRPGADAVHSHMTNSRLTDPEILERRFPVRLESFHVRRGSGGAGAMRGGDGAVRRLRFLGPMQVALLSTRRTHAPKGIAGGGDGLPGAQRLIGANGSSRELDGCFAVSVQTNETVEIETPGGGGFGLSPARPTV